MTELYLTYAENIRMAAKQQKLKISQIATATGYSFEHIRKIWMGRTDKHKDHRLTISRECNDLLCQMLGLPADEMFALAEREKFAQKNGYAPLQLPDPAGQELAARWNDLDDTQKGLLLRMAHSFAQERQLAKAG